jgi:hypothetical protein
MFCGAILAMIGGRMDGLVADRFSQIAIFFILGPLIAWLALAKLGHFWDWRKPLKDALHRFGSRHYTHQIAVGIVVFIALISGYLSIVLHR